MSDAPEKKVRSAAQLAANQRSKNLGKEAMAWLESKGLKKSVVNVGFYRQQKKEGKTNDEIVELIRGRQGARPEAAPKKKNATLKNKPANNTTQNAKKPRSAAQNAATRKLKNNAATFKAAGVKFSGPAYKYYKEQKKAGRNNTQLLASMKARFPAANAEGKAIVAKRVTVKKANAPAAAAPLGAKGSYVCEKCTYVPNNSNGSRKNNTRNRAYYTNVNNTNFRYF